MAFLQDEQVYTCVYVVCVCRVSLFVCVRVWECLWCGRPKRQRTFLKFERSLLNRQMANSSQPALRDFILFEEKESTKNTHAHTFTQVSENSNILLHFEFTA